MGLNYISIELDYIKIGRWLRTYGVLIGRILELFFLICSCIHFSWIIKSNYRCRPSCRYRKLEHLPAKRFLSEHFAITRGANCTKLSPELNQLNVLRFLRSAFNDAYHLMLTQSLGIINHRCVLYYIFITCNSAFYIYLIQKQLEPIDFRDELILISYHVSQ